MRIGKSWDGGIVEKLFVFGLGYSALVLAQRLAGQGWTVAGTSRDGVNDTIPFERQQPLSNAAGQLAGTTHLLLSIPPDQAGDPVLACHAEVVAKLPDLRWIGYLSTTGVYIYRWTCLLAGDCITSGAYYLLCLSHYK